MKNYEILHSPSELRIRVFGATIGDLFRHALQAMFESIEPTIAKDERVVEHRISVTAKDQEQLLVDFLSEALYQSDVNNEAFFDVRFEKLSELSVSAVILGRKATAFSTEIKAVTYHDVHIIQKGGRLSTEILFDV